MSPAGTSFRDAATGAAAALLLAVTRLVPRQRAIALGAALGRLWVTLRMPRTRAGLENLRIAFPTWSEPRRRRLLRQAFANLGRSLAEIPHLRDLTSENLDRFVEMEGFHHLEKARERAGGVIALTAHLGNWELFAVAMGLRGIPLTIVHRERDPVLESMMRDWRERGETVVLPRGSAARATLKALRGQRVVAMPLDQDTPRSEGVFVPFFGRMACTRGAPARIAMRLNVPVVPAFIFRLPEGDRHVVRFRPPLELVPSGPDPGAAVRENVERMSRAIEEAIREAPEQWTWNHRRWRTQLEGDARPYRSRKRMRTSIIAPAPPPPEFPDGNDQEIESQNRIR